MVDSAKGMIETPQGIGEVDIRDQRWHQYLNSGSVLLMFMFLMAAMFGIFGGQPHPTRKIETSAALIRMQFPEVLRNGQFFEMRANIKAKKDFDNMRLGISTSYWHDLTINSMVPAAIDESSKGGKYQFSYGMVKTGENVTIKIDGQINPPLFAGTKGILTLMDGDETLAIIPIKLTVLP